MLVIVKLNDSCYGIRGWLHFKVADFVGLVNFEWHSQNKVGNVGILVLQRDCEKLYSFSVRSNRDTFHVRRFSAIYSLREFFLQTFNQVLSSSDEFSWEYWTLKSSLNRMYSMILKDRYDGFLPPVRG